MCGIVGLFLKQDSFEPHLGSMLSTMLATMRDRGPDSAGFAVYGADVDGIKLTVRGRHRLHRIAADLGVSAEIRDTHAVLHVPEAALASVRADLERQGVTVVGEGRSMELYKEVGLPERGRVPLRAGEDVRHARHRPHAHGDRERGHHRRRTSLQHWPRPVPGA